jgi:Icc-related predicted phosphoesterase
MLDQIKLVFSTLWSDISPINLWTIQQSISDFHLIRYNGEKFSAYYFNQLHLACREFLEASLQDEKNRSNTVVITHHVPTFLNFPPQYSNDPLNEAFGVELGDFIEQHGPAFWIYGHHHHNIAPFKIGNTQLITNQLGYVQYNEHKAFNKMAIIDL